MVIRKCLLNMTSLAQNLLFFLKVFYFLSSYSLNRRRRGSLLMSFLEVV